MKKITKIFIAILTVAMIASCTLAFVGCDGDTTVNAEKVKVIDIELTAESYAYIVKKGDTAMKTAIDELLTELKANGQLDSIINSFFDGTATFEYTNPTSQENCLVVATNAYFPPFEYYSGNKLSGVDMKIASLLAEKMGKTLFILDEAFDSVFTSVSNGEAAIGMAGITVNETRKKTFDFSIEYYESAQVLTVAANDKTFDKCTKAEEIVEILAKQGKSYTVGTQSATTGYMYTYGDVDFEYDGFTNLTVNGYTTGALAMADLANGKINAVILDKQPSLMIANTINRK